MADIGLFNALKIKMSWLAHRQRVVAENVANASTPGYRARDLKPLDFKSTLAGQGPNGNNPAETLTMTQPGHMALPGASNAAGKAVNAPDSETTLNRNSVTLEDEMIKMADSRMQFEAALGFYQKSLDMLRMASRQPGK